MKVETFIMANRIKYRKCPECGSRMVLRKSHSKGTKFWGCTKWKETDCSGSAPHYGDGARAGLNLDIREIKNGYIVTTSPKYAESVGDDDPVEQHVKDQEELKEILRKLFSEQVEDLCKRIENSTEFVDEIDEEKHEKRVKVARKGTTNVNELLKRIAATKDQVEETESD